MTKPPASCTHFGVALTGALCMAAAFYGGCHLKLEAVPYMFFTLLAFAVPIIVMEVLFFKVHRRPTTGLDFDKKFSPDLRRVALKFLGIALTLVPIALFYHFASEYREAVYASFFVYLGIIYPYVLAVGAVYIFVVDGWQREPMDIYALLGLKLLQWKDTVIARGDLAEHAGATIIKAFFIPVMFIYLVPNVDYLSIHCRNPLPDDNPWLLGYTFGIIPWYLSITLLIFTIDLGIAMLGYIFSLRLLDTHIRSSHPYALGWIAAIACYKPFNEAVMSKYAHFAPDVEWQYLLFPYEVLLYAWAAVTMVVVLFYASSTIAFGLRFSNLTHRGILTNGPYRYTKHPAYVMKCIMWGLALLPFLFLSGQPDRICQLLFGYTLAILIYYVRAKTEEKHLSEDPDYVAYALWMNDHGLFRGVARLLPFLKYRQKGLTEPSKIP